MRRSGNGVISKYPPFGTEIPPGNRGALFLSTVVTQRAAVYTGRVQTHSNQMEKPKRGDGIGISDETGDRRYFSLVPHVVVNHSTVFEQGLYLQMKRYAGENGLCFASRETLMKSLGIGRKQLTKSMKYLLDKGWIKEGGLKPVQTPGGPQKVKVYVMVDLWEMNIRQYDKGVSESAPLEPKGGSESASKGCSLDTTKKKSREEENRDSDAPQKAVALSWSFQSAMKALEESPRRDMNIVAFFIEQKRLKPENRDQMAAMVRRHLRAAGALKAFSDPQLVSAAKTAEKEYPGMWTLETLVKILTK